MTSPEPVKEPRSSSPGTSHAATPQSLAARLIHPQHQFLSDTSLRNPVRPWHLGIALALLAFGVYAGTATWLPAGSSSTSFLVQHLGLDLSVSLSDLPWDLWLRIADRLPGLDVAGWTTLLCAALAAATVGLLTTLMGRVAYFYTPDAAPADIRREAVARRIAGVVAGTYLLVSFPAWWSATHALPSILVAFHLLLAAMLFSLFQRTGRLSWLVLFSFTWGLGCAWNADFWILSLPVLFLIIREFFRWGHLARWRAYPAFLLPGLLGAAAFVPAVAWAWGHGGAALYPTPADLAGASLSAIVGQLGIVVGLTPLLLLLIAVAFAPWWILFPLSRRSPWYYEKGQILIRLLLVGHVFSLLFNVPYAPWRLLGGRDNPFLVPALFLAGSAGYLAGEFWCLGEIFPFKDSQLAIRIAKRALSTLAVLIAPACLLVGAMGNVPQLLQFRATALPWTIANEVLAQREGRSVFLADSLFADALLLAAHERHEPIVVIQNPADSTPLQLAALRAAYPPLANLFVPGTPWNRLGAEYLSLRGAPEATVILPASEFARAFATLMPRGFACHAYTLPPAESSRAGSHLAPTAPPINPAAPPALEVADREAPFYAALAAWRRRPVPKDTPEFALRALLCSLASRYANDLALDLARQRHLQPAREALATALALDPDNLAALLNDAQFSGTAHLALPDSPEAAASPCIPALKAYASRNAASMSRAWSLGTRSGLVSSPERWFRAGVPWALSGAMPSRDDILPPPERAFVGLLADSNPMAFWFQCALGRIGTRFATPAQLCAAMARSPFDPAPLAELARTYLMQNRPVMAAAALDAAMALQPADAPGYPFEELLADAALGRLLSPDFPPHPGTLDDVVAPRIPRYPRRWTSRFLLPSGFRQALLQAATDAPSDLRPWIALWMLEPAAPTGIMAADKLKARTRSTPVLALTQAAALLRSTDPAAPLRAQALLAPLETALPTSAVVWRLSYEAARQASDPFGQHLAYLNLQALLPRKALSAILPNHRRAILGTQLRASIRPIPASLE